MAEKQICGSGIGEVRSVRLLPFMRVVVVRLALHMWRTQYLCRLIAAE